MSSAAWRLRAGALLLAGALVVHELRYALTGAHADEHAHTYMGWLGPVACGVVVLTVAELAFRIARRAAPREPSPVPGLRTRALGLGLLLMAIFAVQEAVEALAAHGDPRAAAGSLLAHGSWLAAPLSVAVGTLIALLLRGARALLERLVARPPRSWPRVPARPLRHRAAPLVRPGVLASHLAGRAPPTPLLV